MGPDQEGRVVQIARATELAIVERDGATLLLMACEDTDGKPCRIEIPLALAQGAFDLTGPAVADDSASLPRTFLQVTAVSIERWPDRKGIALAFAHENRRETRLLLPGTDAAADLGRRLLALATAPDRQAVQ